MTDMTPKNKNTLIKSKRAFVALLGSVILISSSMLSGCGFHLRGYDTPMTYAVASTLLSIDDDPTSFRLKLPLKQKLNAVGINVVDDIGRQINTSNQLYTGIIKIDNVRFKRYELVGVLTEVRLVLSADVIYETLISDSGQNGKPVVVKNNIQVERSYQFDQASVSIEDKQGQQIRDWLYESLSQRIVDQYVALSLPRISPPATDNVNQKSQIIQESQKSKNDQYGSDLSEKVIAKNNFLFNQTSKNVN